MTSISQPQQLTTDNSLPESTLELGKFRFDYTFRPLVMGILNKTPDSFFDKGAYYEADRFLRRAASLVGDGADILDVGGVKAGPGEPVSVSEEMDRVTSSVEALVSRFDLPISIDTWRSEVASECFAKGAVIGNDISGFADPAYLEVASLAGASVIATHIRLAPRVPDPDPAYPNDDVVTAVESRLTELCNKAIEAGIKPGRIIIDAGLDLGKTSAQSLELLRASRSLASLGYPLLLSASNKTFLGDLLGKSIDDRRDASLCAAALGASLGCRLLRVHDVAGTKRIVNTLIAIFEAQP